MTLATTTNRASFNGSGSTGPFSFNFRFFDNSEISVLRGATILVETTDYTVAGANSYSGGSVTLVDALTIGETLTITRAIPLTQSTSIRNQGAFYPEIHENAFDRLTMQIQQVDTIADDATAVSATALSTSNTALATSQAALETASAGAQIFILQGAAGTVTVTRAAANEFAPVTAVLPTSGEVVVIKTDAYGFPVVIEPAPGQTVSGGASISLTVQNESVRLLLFGTNWDEI